MVARLLGVLVQKLLNSLGEGIYKALGLVHWKLLGGIAVLGIEGGLVPCAEATSGGNVEVPV